MSTFGQGIGIGIGLDLSLQAGTRTTDDVEPIIRIIVPSREYILTGYVFEITTPDPEETFFWLWEDGDSVQWEDNDLLIQELA